MKRPTKAAVLLIAGVAPAWLLLGGGLALATGSAKPATTTTPTFYACSGPKGWVGGILLHPPASCAIGNAIVSWNAVGPQGPAGVQGPAGAGVTSTALSSGDPNCPDGGSSFTSSGPTTYACNGADGAPGAAGTQGSVGPQGAPGVVYSCSTTPYPGIDLAECTVPPADLTNPTTNVGQDLTGANLAGADLSGDDPLRTNLAGANLVDANLSSLDVIAGTDIALPAGLNLVGANLTGANLTNASLEADDVVGVNIAGVIWNNTTCPDASNSDQDGGTCANNMTGVPWGGYS